MNTNIDLELLIKKQNDYNEKAKINYHLRSLKGTNKKLIPKEEQKKAGRPSKPKEDILINKKPKGIIGRPKKEITLDDIATKKYSHLVNCIKNIKTYRNN